MNKWISVQEKMPEAEDFYVVYCKGRTKGIRFRKLVIWHDGTKQFIINGSKDKSVTHWLDGLQEPK